MPVLEFLKTHGRKVAVVAAIAGGLSLATAPQPAQARDGAGIALGVLGGAAVGAAIASTANPYYNPGYYYAPPPPAYYPPAPGYAPGYAPRSCWDPYYRRYYGC